MDVLHKTFSPEPLAGPDMATQIRNIAVADFTLFGVDDDCFQFKGSTSRSTSLSTAGFRKETNTIADDIQVQAISTIPGEVVSSQTIEKI